MLSLRKTTARLVLAAMVTLGACAGAVAAVSGGGSRAQLTAFVCQRALDPPARAVSVTAVMRPVAGTQKLELQFDLLSRAPNATSFSPVSGSGLGAWITPTDPTLGQRPGDIWKLSHPVADLPAPAVYRFSVDFRWLGSGGRVLKDVVLQSHSCVQPELRPDLYVQSFTAQPVAGHPKLDQYIAVIGNQGGGPAKNFELTFTDGAKSVTRTIDYLGKQALKTVDFQGPLCLSGAPPTLVLDPTSVVDDSNRANNTASATCPSPTGTTGQTG